MGARVLIVDDVATNRIVMKVKLQAAGYQALVAVDAKACLSVAARELPDLILLDLILPDLSGIEVVRHLRADPATQSIPVVILTASPDAAARVRAFRAGVDDFLPKSTDEQTLMARIRSLLRARDAMTGLSPAGGGLAMLGMAEPVMPFQAPGHVALVMARPEAALRLRRDLMGRLGGKVVVMSADEALKAGTPPHHTPDVFVIDGDLEGAGLRLMSDLRSRTTTRNAAIALFLGNGTTVLPAMALDLGADDLLDSSAAAEETALRLGRLVRHKHAADHLRASVQDGLRLAVIDPLTGLHNRRYGLAQLHAIADRAQQARDSFAVLVLDLDRFKTVNDRWGHASGDAVLVEVAQRLRANLRDGDLLARIGGEEFLVALPAISLPQARSIAERLCDAVHEQPISLPCDAEITVTASIGLAISEGGAPPAQVDWVTAIVDRADRALLRSKAAGRNQVTIGRSAA